MAQVIAIGEPANDTERQAIAWLRDHLPYSYTILHNFELSRDHFEVDIAVIAPHAVYLVDVKGTRGLIDVYGSKWHPEGRQPFTSPLLKLHSHAKTLKGLITASQPGLRDLEGVYVDGAVVLTAPEARLMDPGGRDADAVTTLKKSGSFFQDATRIPGNYSKSIAPLHRMIRSVIEGAARPRKGPLVLGNWEVVERLGGPDAYTEYRAINVFAGRRGGTSLLRVYRADPYLPADEREAQRTRIANSYSALNHMPGHPGIATARDFFATEHEDRLVLVTEDVPGQALRLHIDKPSLALTFDQKLRVARELFDALDHCHRHEVVHRNLTPATILLGTDGHVRLTGFDFARAGSDRSRTIADEIVDELDPLYAAPEAYRDPGSASALSDVFGAGLVLYELFTGERPFADPTEVFDQAGVFPQKASTHRQEVTAALDAWLQKLCAFDPAERPSAGEALSQLDAILAASASTDLDEASTLTAPELVPAELAVALEYGDLPRGTLLLNKLEVQEKRGSGSFGVVYRVVDTLGDVTRAIKLILHDRHSTLDRLKKEYRTLLRVPEHPYVVKVIDANVLDGAGPPYLLFEYVNGEDLGELIDSGRFAPEDVLELLRQVAEGLAHLHAHGVHHCDIKPRNLIWTAQGAKIIDFNVATHRDDSGHGGGSRRYIPPDLDLSGIPATNDLTDRDLYALGLTAYEALAGYPWDASTPPPGEPAPDPRRQPGLDRLAPDFVKVLLQAIAPRRAERFESAADLLAALGTVGSARRPPSESESTSTWQVLSLAGTAEIPPNTNPFVSHLLTLYSQSSRTNAGTRGLDALGRETYVPTRLDDRLLPAVLDGELRLVVITGNAGDGKTAFIEKLEEAAKKKQAIFDPPLANGRRFTLNGRTYLTNYDGSQDEKERGNDDVLRSFFEPFADEDPGSWPSEEVRLIAINEGRLIDFLAKEERFPALRRIVEVGLATGVPQEGIAVVNLNLRSLVVGSMEQGGSIFESLAHRLLHEKFWSPCQACNLKDRCYVFHNVQTFLDPTAGPRVLERLKTLYTLTQLRGRLHVTLRDLRSALAYMLAGTRDCAEIHELYRAGRREEFAQGFYFNSWMGGDGPTNDRLLTLLKDLDVGRTPDPRLDRAFDFVSPHLDRSLFRFAQRGEYDREVLRALFRELPRDFSGKPTERRSTSHRRFVAMARRRSFFERRDEGWRSMLPYRSAERMLALVRGEAELAEALPGFLRAINRGEGVSDPDCLQGGLALRVRQVERGTIRSYRVFPPERFHLEVRDAPTEARFVEHMPDALVLRYRGDGSEAELIINLDMFEMLARLNEGYRPSLEEEQGYYLSLAVFKNVLGSAPYQEVLLTTTGHDFYRIERHPDSRLEMSRVGKEVS